MAIWSILDLTVNPFTLSLGSIGFGMPWFMLALRRMTSKKYAEAAVAIGALCLFGPPVMHGWFAVGAVGLRVFAIWMVWVVTARDDPERPLEKSKGSEVPPEATQT